MNRAFRPVLALALTVLAAAPLAAQRVEVEEFTLDNGMKFLLLPRDDQPNSITAGWAAKVGSVNEYPGITGISHFFEHMMFKGTRTIGTRDAAMDADYIARQEKVRAALRDLHLQVQYARWQAGEIEDPWDAANDTPEMKKLRDDLRSLQDEQREITIKNEFDKVYSSEGGNRMNAFTNQDLTFYFISIPSNKLELWAWMESDRLKNSVFREFYSERDVVHEERRLRTESTPIGKFQEQFDAMFWQSSPYSWPVVGWPSDLNAYTREQAQHYYDTYYRPNNLVGVVVGDFDGEQAKSTIRRYFSRLERGVPPPPVLTIEMPQVAEKRMNAECDCQPQVEVRYHTVPFGHADEAPLEVMAEILNGRTGRLYKSMVEGAQIAASASVGQGSRKYGGAFSFRAECKGDAAPEQLEQAWYKELARLQSEPVSDHELEKVKNRVLAESFRRLETNFFLMLQLGYSEAIVGWEYVNTYPEMMRQVTAADVHRVANTYFDETQRCVATYRRKEGTAPVDPELAAFPPQIRAMVRQVLKQVSTVQDAAQLRQMMQQIEGRMAQAPPEFQSAAEYMLGKIRERLSTLEGGGK